MKKIMLLCALPALFIGCVPKSELEKSQSDLSSAQAKITSLESELVKRPSDLAGTWRCQTTQPAKVPVNNSPRPGAPPEGGYPPYTIDATLTLNANGRGSFMASSSSGPDSYIGPWEKAGEYLFVEGLNSEFVCFKIASKSESKITLINREGRILEFTKIR